MKRSRQVSKSNPLALATTEDAAASSNNLPDKKLKYSAETSLSVQLSAHDKAGNLSLSDDKLWCWGDRDTGFCLARATHAVDSGKYFWECEILAVNSRPTVSMQESSPAILENVAAESAYAHVRLGWATAEAAIMAPVGYDAFGFAYRDVYGSKVHNGVRTDGYGDSFGIGDVIGCHINLDRLDSSRNEIRFFKNGIDQGIAFRGSVIQGVYFPAISLYRDACVRVNFGPFFIYPFNHVQKLASQTGEFCELAKDYDFHYFMGTLPVSELQPMSTEQMKVHGEYVSRKRTFYYSSATRVVVNSSANSDVNGSNSTKQND